MALKNLFDMVKADKYTADGREALIKAQEAETEDKVYQIGEISQKTGLQKTANGWVKPTESKPAEEIDLPKKEETRKVIAPMWRKQPSGAASLDLAEVAQNAGVTPEEAKAIAENTEGLKVSKYMDKYIIEPSPDYGRSESKSAAGNNLPDIPDFKEMESGDYDKRLRAEGWTTGGWEGNGTHASAIFKKGDRTIRVNEGQPGKITSVQEISKPAEKLPAKPTRGMSESYIRGTQLMKPAEDESQRGEQHWAGVLSGYDNTSVIEQRKQLQEKYDEFEEDIKDYDRRGLAPAVYAKRINQQNFIKGALKAIDDEMENRGMDPAPRTSVPDAAPRVLTGDTRIRVRKA